MKTIGLIGGISWKSSDEYYRIINETVQTKLGGLHSAKSIMYSVDFAEIVNFQNQGRWKEVAQTMVGAAQGLERCGADFIVLCANTMHKVVDQIHAHTNIPVLHVVDATAKQIKNSSIHRVGLLGTRFTMEEDFYKNRLIQRHSLEVIIPQAQEREIVNRVIFDELVKGKIRQDSKELYLGIIENLVRDGAEGIILGCTEIGLLIHHGDCKTPLFDTTRIHALAAVEYALVE